MPRIRSEREQLQLFRALPGGDIAPRDAQDLMAYPFFSLAKSRRTVPIHFEAGGVSLPVEGVPEHGIATIWDADVLIWAASQIVQARDRGLSTSRLMAVTPHEILTFVQRGTGLKDYLMLKAALDRLQSTTVATSIRQPAGRRLHRFSWINEWKELAGPRGRAYGIELILADWFYAGVMDDALVLTLDPAYFRLTGGIERWLYRIVRKHGGWQRKGWRFDFRHLHLKSGSLQRYSDFALHLRQLARRQSLPGYRLSIQCEGAAELLAFRIALDEMGLSTRDGENRVDKLCSDSGIARTQFGESPADDSGNHLHGSAGEAHQCSLCGLPNLSN
jgi:plasmid replication initiation protein